MPSTRARPQSEILQLQQEVFNEVQGDTEHLSQAIFGDVDNQPDLGSVSNERIDDIYRQAYQRGDRDFLQREARRDPEQFLRASERIGARVPPPQPTPAPPAMPAPPMPPAMPMPAPPMPMPGVGGPALPAPAPPMPVAPAPIVPMATGGLVTQPTVALIGEAGPEAVVPLTGAGGGAYGDPRSAIPGASADSPAYFVRQSLENAQWSPEATKWAIQNVPTRYTPDVIAGDPANSGMYWPAGPLAGNVAGSLSTGNPANPYYSAPETEDITRHELQHAWDIQRQGGQFASPDEVYAAVAPLGVMEPEGLAFLMAEARRDPAHVTNLLYDWLGPEGIQRLNPAFRNRYFGNMG